MSLRIPLLRSFHDLCHRLTYPDDTGRNQQVLRTHGDGVDQVWSDRTFVLLRQPQREPFADARRLAVAVSPTRPRRNSPPQVAGLFLVVDVQENLAGPFRQAFEVIRVGALVTPGGQVRDDVEGS